MVIVILLKESFMKVYVMNNLCSQSIWILMVAMHRKIKFFFSELLFVNNCRFGKASLKDVD